ncbi:hypothetical protein AB0C65_22255 [Nocardia sp. NPDC048505]|uniref:hypothetical protein n=1 Tax=Nocardia sp. NPDC048505 TaxID=3155756 RepID=UPI0033F0A416
MPHNGVICASLETGAELRHGEGTSAWPHGGNAALRHETDTALQHGQGTSAWTHGGNTAPQPETDTALWHDQGSSAWAHGGNAALRLGAGESPIRQHDGDAGWPIGRGGAAGLSPDDGMQRPYSGDMSFGGSALTSTRDSGAPDWSYADNAAAWSRGGTVPRPHDSSAATLFHENGARAAEHAGVASITPRYREAFASMHSGDAVFAPGSGGVLVAPRGRDMEVVPRTGALVPVRGRALVAARESGAGISRLAVAGCLIALFMQLVDMVTICLALPSIAAGLPVSPAQRVLVVAGSAVAFACSLGSARRLGERFGWRGMFLGSVAAYAAASAWCALADSGAELVLARVAQGAAGAGVAAQAVAVILAAVAQKAVAPGVAAEAVEIETARVAHRAGAGMTAQAVGVVVAGQGDAGAGVAARAARVAPTWATHRTACVATKALRVARQRQSMVIALAAVMGGVGLVVGGLFVSDVGGFGWRVVFLMNVPFGLIAFVLGARCLRGGPVGREPLPMRGVVMAGIALFALVLALAEIHQSGWRPGAVLLGGVAVVLLGAFLRQQSVLARRGDSSLVPLELFADRRFALDALLVALFAALLTTFVFAVSGMLQDGLHFSALRAALALTPFGLGAAAGVAAAPGLARRWGGAVFAIGIAAFGAWAALDGAYLQITGGAIDLRFAVLPIFLSGLGVGVYGARPLLTAARRVRTRTSIGVLLSAGQLGAGLGSATLAAVFFRSYTLGGGIAVLSAIALLALVLAALTLALPAPGAPE